MAIKKPDEANGTGNGYGSIWWLPVILIIILVAGIGIAFWSRNFFAVPFSVVIMGIVSFFGVYKLSKSSDDTAVMRRAITVSILVVYLGLLPTLAFQGILQFQVTGNTSTEISGLNETVVQAIPQAVSLSETVVTSFTALVAAVLLFYFGSRSMESYFSYLKKEKTDGDTTDTTSATATTTDTPKEAVAASSDPTKTEKETTVAKYDKDGKLIGKTVTTERIKSVKESTETTVVIKQS